LNSKTSSVNLSSNILARKSASSTEIRGLLAIRVTISWEKFSSYKLFNMLYMVNKLKPVLWILNLLVLAVQNYNYGYGLTTMISIVFWVSDGMSLIVRVIELNLISFLLPHLFAEVHLMVHLIYNSWIQSLNIQHQLSVCEEGFPKLKMLNSITIRFTKIIILWHFTLYILQKIKKPNKPQISHLHHLQFPFSINN